MKTKKYLALWISAIGSTALCYSLLFSGCSAPPRSTRSLPANFAANGDGSPDGLITGGLRTSGNAQLRSISDSSAPQELWIIARGSNPTLETNENVPQSGSLLTTVEDKEVPLPLKHTDVKASVSGYISTVEVTQQFNNPYEQKIEAVYVFPVPQNAAINEFIMTIGKRRIRGIIREREEAEKLYQEAKRQGYVASLLTVERPNIFTQSVANIEPGNEIDVDIQYFNTLDYVDGWYEFVFPMVVGPRFNPSGATNGVGAIARDGNGTSGQNTEVTYLRPDERSGHDISLRVDVDASVPIEQFECKTHAIANVSSAGHLIIQLDPHDTIPNKDFVLRYRVAGDQIKSSLLTAHDEQGGYFTLMLYPPQELGNLHRQPLELVFVLDCSGSMSGRPIEQAKVAIERGLGLLQPGDSFQLINFSSGASQLGPKPLDATPENVQRGLNYLHSLNADGDTMMVEGLKAALDFPHDPQRLRFVCFLTDGYIGNESEILGELHNRIGDSRIFSFGIGSSVNRYLLDHMAKAGRGAVAYLGPNDNAAATMENFFDRIRHPALTDIKIDWGAMGVSDVFPRETPDLFPGRPVILTGRFSGTGSTTVHITGSAGNTQLQFEVQANLSDTTATTKALPTIWARMKISDLVDQSIYAPNPQLPYEIKQLALDYSLMSPFTAFLAVDAGDSTEGSASTTVPVAVPVPEGANTNKTVPEN